MAVLAGALVAVAGWMANAYLNRRASRRAVRIDYLLSAYRRLEHASNRRMDAEHEIALEEAVSDIQLLGSRRQVELATAFAQRFAENREASANALLQDLRVTLRAELQLENVPPLQTWLRIERVGGDVGPVTGENFLAVWSLHREVIKDSLATDGADIRTEKVVDPVQSEHRTSFVAEMASRASSSPIDAVAHAEWALADRLRRLLESAGFSTTPGLRYPDLTSMAHERGLIDEQTRRGLQGLYAMHTMAVLDEGGRNLTEAKALDFVGLTEALLFVLDAPGTAR
jgi:hypothetical protein